MGKNWFSGLPVEASLTAAEMRQLRTFEIICRHFAYLERALDGEVSFEMPTYGASGSCVLAGAPRVQAEKLARLERERLGLGAEPVCDLEGLLDGMGIKVIGVAMPQRSPIAGGFLFRSDIGPCIMVNDSLRQEERLMALAHQYCHFLADYDPYVPRVCRRWKSDVEDATEQRAWEFASAFLVPETALGDLTRGVGTGSEVNLPALSVYFGVPMVVVARRLEAAGVEVPEPQEAAVCGEELPTPHAGARVPRSLVRLAVRARGRGLISPLRMARLLQSSVEVAESLLAYSAEDQAGDAGDAEDGSGSGRV